jgi:hypothetical protein
MSWFWIAGIAANVILTALAIVWVIRQGRPTRPSADEDREPPA